MGKYTEAWERHGTQEKAAAALGIGQRSFERGLKRERSGTPEPPKPPPSNKLNLSGISEQAAPVTDKPVTVVYFTDAHNQPGMSLERFKWLCGLVNDVKPDFFINGGDTDEVGSLSNHEKNETYKGRLKPLVAADLEASAYMAALIKDNLKHPCVKMTSLGNHEFRINTYENNNPAMYGIISNIYHEIWESCGWTLYEYGAYIDVAGVHFTHVPFDQNGKPVQGENAVKKVAEKSQRDTVFGHLHYETIIRAHKFGGGNSVTVLGAACFMPDGYRPDYVKNTRKEYNYGCYVLRIHKGRIDSIKAYSMAELEETYGG